MEQYAPEQLASREEIRDVMLKWCRAIDRLDRQGMLDCFHPEAVDEHGPYNGDLPGLCDWVIDRHQVIPFSSHQVSNMLIEFASPELALAETYVRTLQRYPAEATEALRGLTASGGTDGQACDLMTSSRYIDRFERRGGVWKIAHRKLAHDWKQVIPVTAATPANNPAWIHGRRDADDVIYAERRALGIA